MLKPGGRMVVCTSTVKEDLPEDIKWPVCMQVFVKLKELEPMVKDIGFEGVVIDASDSLMSVEVEEEEEELVVVEEEEVRKVNTTHAQHRISNWSLRS